MRLLPFLSLFLIVLVSCSPSISGRTTTEPIANTASPADTVAPLPTMTQTLTPKPATLRPSITPPATIDEISYSPDGKYVAQRYDVYGLAGKPVIQIFDGQNKLLWEIPYQDEMPTDYSRALLSIYKWADDSSGLYFFYFALSDPTYNFWDGLNLQKLDVRTGLIEKVIPGTQQISFAFSPDDANIAYARYEDTPRKLMIRNLSTNSDKNINIDRSSLDDDLDIPSDDLIQIGRIYWSPSGKHVLYHVGYGEHIWAYYLDTKTMTQKEILKFWLGDDYWLDGWTTDEQPRYRQLRQNSEVFVIDVNTGEVTMIGTATSIP